jgi:putative ABC transport system permease protein
MQKWLQDFAYRVEIGWWVLALAAGGGILIAFFTTIFQSLRAANANPLKNLRSE